MELDTATRTARPTTGGVGSTGRQQDSRRHGIHRAPFGHSSIQADRAAPPAGRRVAAADIVAPIGSHSFRATGITANLKKGEALEYEQAMTERVRRRLVSPRCRLSVLNVVAETD
jgi:hypothetical protein